MNTETYISNNIMKLISYQIHLLHVRKPHFRELYDMKAEYRIKTEQKISTLLEL